MSEEQTEFGNEDPVWIDRTWLDTVVVVGLTCFILCLMGLSKVRQKKVLLFAVVNHVVWLLLLLRIYSSSIWLAMHVFLPYAKIIVAHTHTHTQPACSYYLILLLIYE